MKWCVSLFFIAIIQVSRAIRCSREHEYVASDGSCQQCEMCPPGYEPTMFHCGYGQKDPLYACKPCNEGTFSVSTDYKFCITCSPCEKWNAFTMSKCTKTSNATCGECHRGYYRPKKADGVEDVECHKCNHSSNSNCQTNNWVVITIILSTVCVITLLIAAIFACLFWKSNKTKKREKSELAPKVREFRQSLVSCNRSTLSTSCELLTATPKNLSENKTNQLLIDLDMDSYSNRPTAQFQQPCPYSQLSTARFSSQLSMAGRTTNTPFGFESVDLLRQDVDIFDTTSISNPSTSLPLVPV